MVLVENTSSYQGYDVGKTIVWISFIKHTVVAEHWIFDVFY